MKTYIVRETLKNAKAYFAGTEVLQGTYNGKAAVYVSSDYFPEELVKATEVYSASASQRYLGTFKPEKLVKMEDAKGIVLVAK